MPRFEPPPGARRVLPDTTIRLNVRASVAAATATIFANVVITSDDGTTQVYEARNVSHTGDRANEPTDLGRTGSSLGWVTGAHIGLDTGTAKRGQIYATLNLGPLRHGLNAELCAGYIFEGKSLSIGEHIDPGPAGGHGNLRSITGTNPAAGSNISEAVPTDALWRIHSIEVSNVQVTTSPNVGWRITDGTNTLYDTSRLAQTAGATEVHVVSTVHQPELDGTSAQKFPIPDTYLPEAFTIGTVGVDANSDFGAPQMLIEEWLVI